MSQNSEFKNRELSWLDFNDRVLSLTQQGDIPLLERFKFLGIWNSNLDEFFQIRVAETKAKLNYGISSEANVDELTSIQLAVNKQIEVAKDSFSELIKELSLHGIDVVSIAELDAKEAAFVEHYIHSEVTSVLTPLGVHPGHPFPYVSNLSLSIGVMLRDKALLVKRFARIKIPPNLNRLIQLPNVKKFVLLEEAIMSALPELFPDMEIIDTVLFRVTRSADLEIDEEQADDLLTAIENELSRMKFREVVRLEVSKPLSDDFKENLSNELGILDCDIYVNPIPISPEPSFELSKLDEDNLHYPPHTPSIPRDFLEENPAKPSLFPSVSSPVSDIFSVLRYKDVLVHHPYESFDHTVGEFIRQAAEDPDVQAIKMTLYRTDGDGAIISSLLRAAEQGKQVAVIIELKARFDEAANIQWAKTLEEAGAHVVYGLVGLKIHSKMTLVIRKENNRIVRYSHIGTGNYNSLTARTYTDFGLLTSDNIIGNEIGELFNSLTAYGKQREFQNLLVAPFQLREKMKELIKNEISYGEAGHIRMKMNALVDQELIDLLYQAAYEGTKVDLQVRGICCLTLRNEKIAERISVRSVLGRFLEHSRLYWFANGKGPDESSCYIGSADLMPRNLNRRVEVLAPVNDEIISNHLIEIFEHGFNDRHLSWDLDSYGNWVKNGTDPTSSSQNIEINKSR